MALDLITPLESNFLKEFPGQHAQNVDEIDEFAGPCLTSDPLQEWLPLFSATTSNPSLGTTGAVQRGVYYTLFDQVYFWGELRFGSAGSPSGGTGTWLVSLPVAASSNFAFSTNIGQAQCIGTGSVWDNDSAGGRTPITVHLWDSTHIYFGIKMGSGASSRLVASTGPITWAPSDGIMFSGRYKRDR